MLSCKESPVKQQTPCERPAKRTEEDERNFAEGFERMILETLHDPPYHA